MVTNVNKINPIARITFPSANQYSDSCYRILVYPITKRRGHLTAIVSDCEQVQKSIIGLVGLVPQG